MNRTRVFTATAAVVCVVCGIVALRRSALSKRSTHQVPAVEAAAHRLAVDQVGQAQRSNVQRGAEQEVTEREKRIEAQFLELLNKAKDLMAQRPERPWGEIQNAINPFNHRARAFRNAVERLEEKLTPENIEFQRTHKNEIDAFRAKQAALLFPQTLLQYSDSKDTVGKYSVGDVVSTLLQDEESFQDIVSKLNVGGDIPSGEKAEARAALIQKLRETAPKMAADYTAAAAVLPPNLAALYLAEFAEQSEGFWRTRYYRYLTAEMRPWDERMNDLQRQMIDTLSQLNTDSEVKGRLATQLNDYLQGDSR